MKIETGVMVMKNGKAWGVVYEDGRCSCNGWMDPESAPIHDPAYCKRPTDVVYRGSPDTKELETATLVLVRRVTTVEIVEEMPKLPRP